jgi:membrane-associated protease RseP (regulator of RpoE activity)
VSIALYALGVLIFVLGLLASIALHEIGHMVPAKKFGVRVTQYMVGFGKTIWSTKRGETEYGLKAIPMGGYIRMIGMVPPRKANARFRWPRRMGELVEEFRDTSRHEVGPEDDHRQFYRLTPGKKMIVMLGGPTMNLLIFLVITILLYGIVGAKGPTTTVQSVSQCVVPVTATDENCSASATKTPANGVLLPGDRIISINGLKIDKWASAVKSIEGSAGKLTTLVIERNGENRTVTLTPVTNTKCANEACDKTKQAGFIGISTTEGYFRQSPGDIASIVWQRLGLSVDALKAFPAKMSSLWGTVFDGKPRDKAGAVGVIGLGRIGGEIAQSKQVDTLDKLSALLDLLAGVNLLLFFFNLLPLLPLDGGHVAGAIVEAARRGIARLRGQSRQIYVDLAQMVPVMYLVAVVMIGLSLLVMYADIVKPITLN